MFFLPREVEDKENEQEWHPTHLRVTVLRASSLRSKGTTSNSYVVIQLQKQKFRTSIASCSITPEWHEECLLQLPSVLDDTEEHSLILTVMQQSLHHFNRFVGRVSLPLAQLFQDKTKRKNEWAQSTNQQHTHPVRDKLRSPIQDIGWYQVWNMGECSKRG